MYRDPMDDIFESFVRAAVIENGLREAEACPQNDALFDIHLSSKCERSVTRNACKLKRRKKLLRMSKYVQKTAAIAMISVGISFGFFLSSNNVRAACQDVLVRVYEKFVDISSHKEGLKVISVNVAYIPVGYKEVEREEDHFKSSIIFKNSANKEIVLKYRNKYSNLQIDNEHYIADSIDSTLPNAKFLLSTDSDFPDILFWSTDTGCFTLSAHLPKEEIKRMAESINLSVMK